MGCGLESIFGVSSRRRLGAAAVGAGGARAHLPTDRPNYRGELNIYRHYRVFLRPVCGFVVPEAKPEPEPEPEPEPVPEPEPGQPTDRPTPTDRCHLAPAAAKGSLRARTCAAVDRARRAAGIKARGAIMDACGKLFSDGLDVILDTI